MNINLKKLSSKIWLNVKAGWNMPTLPKHISVLDRTNIYLRLLRIIGPLSMFILISGLGKQINDIAYYSIFGVSLIYIVYKNVIGFFALKQFLHYIKTKKLVVRNSPLDPLGTFFRIFSAGIRTTGRLTVGSGFTWVRIIS